MCLANHVDEPVLHDNQRGAPPRFDVDEVLSVVWCKYQSQNGPPTVAIAAEIAASLKTECCATRLVVQITTATAACTAHVEVSQ